MESPMQLTMRGDGRYEQLKHLVEDYGEVQIRFDSGEETEIHRHNTEFVGEPMVKAVTKGEAHWFDASKIEDLWIHYEF